VGIKKVEDTHLSNCSLKETILLVEDNLIVRDLCREWLELEGYNVCMAGNGKEALEVYENNLINLVLMDLEMPVMSGFEALKEFKLLKAHLPIIALTGKATVNDRRECKQAGFDDILTKPYDGEGLTDMIEKNLPYN
jgi:CheY-like chemotaxis protein